MLTEDQLPHEAPKNVFTRVLGNRTPAWLRPRKPVPELTQNGSGQVSESPDRGVIPETIDIEQVTQHVRAIRTEVEAIQEQGVRIYHELQEIDHTGDPSTQELAVRFIDIASSTEQWRRAVEGQVDTVNADPGIGRLKRIGAGIASLDSAMAAIREQTSVHESDYRARAIAAVSLALSEEWTRKWEEQLNEGNPHPMVELIDTMEEARRIVKEIWNQRESEQAPASIPQVPRASRTPWPVEDDNVLQIQDQGRAHINLDPDISDDDIAALELLFPLTDDEQRDDESGDDEADREPTVPLPLAPRAPEHAENAGGDQNTEHVRLEDYLPVQMEAQVRAMISHLRFESRVAAQQAARFDVQMGTFTSIADPALERLTQDRDAIPDSADVLELYQSLMKSIEVLTAMRTADPEMREEIAQSILTQIDRRSTALRTPQTQESEQGQSTVAQRELALLTFLREQMHAYALPNANVDDILHAIQTRMESFASDEPIISPDTELSDVEGLESILTTRIVDTLRNHQIRTIGQLATLTREALNSILQSEGQGRNLSPINIEDYLRLVTTLREYPPPSSETLEAVNRATTEVRAMEAGTPPDRASSTPLIPSGCLPRIFGSRVWKRVEAMLRKRKKLESPAQPTTPQPPELSQGPTAVSATPLNIDDLEVMGVSVAPLEPVRAPAAPSLPQPPLETPSPGDGLPPDGGNGSAAPGAAIEVRRGELLASHTFHYDRSRNWNMRYYNPSIKLKDQGDVVFGDFGVWAASNETYIAIYLSDNSSAVYKGTKRRLWAEGNEVERASFGDEPSMKMKVGSEFDLVGETLVMHVKVTECTYSPDDNTKFQTFAIEAKVYKKPENGTATSTPLRIPTPAAAVPPAAIPGAGGAPTREAVPDALPNVDELVREEK